MSSSEAKRASSVAAPAAPNASVAGSPGGTQAVDRAAALLVSILESGDAPSFGELQASSGLAKSTLSRLLSSLERHGLVMRSEDGAVRPGIAITRFALSDRSHDALIELTRPAMQRLNEVTGETINLAILVGDEVEQIAQVDCRFLIGNVNWVGQRLPTHCTALGKAFLAGGAPLPAGPLARRTPRTLTTTHRLAADVKEAARRGWALADSELEPGLVAIAAPVRAADGSVVAALSITGPSTRLTPTRIREFARFLVADCNGISSALGFHSTNEHHPKNGYHSKNRKAGAA